MLMKHLVGSTFPCSLARGAALVVSLVTLAAAPLAHAQAVIQPEGPGMRVRGIVSLGVLGGGDRISSFEVSSFGGGTTTQSVRAGGTVDFRGGVDIPLASQWSLQLTAGYVSGGIRADNGKATFTSYPLEALGHYRFAPIARVGLGLRAPLSSSYREGGVAGAGRFDFSASVTPVVEVEWRPNASFGLKLRGMKERYKEKASGIKVDGNTVGLTTSYYF